MAGHEFVGEADSSAQVAVGSEATGADFDRYLTWAEIRFERAEQAYLRGRGLRILSMAGAVAFVLLEATLVLVLDEPNETIGVGVGFVGLVSALAYVLVVERQLIGPGRELCRRDEQSMIDAVTFIRELAAVLAIDEQWSYARKHEADARLSRFPIEPRY